MSGYTLSYRAAWTHPVFRNKAEAAVFKWMCDAAQWQPTRMSTKFGPIDLQRGELIIAERELAEDFCMHRNTIRTLVRKMIDDGMIEVNRDRTPHRAGTIVRIVNYDEYQAPIGNSPSSQDRSGTVNGTAVRTEEGPKEDRSGTKNKEVKEYINTPSNEGGAEAPRNSFEKDYFDTGKRILGAKSGGVLANLLKAKGGTEPAYAVLMAASEAQNPMEYVQAAMRERQRPPPQPARKPDPQFADVWAEQEALVAARYAAREAAKNGHP